jgi:hypothetical protein
MNFGRFRPMIKAVTMSGAIELLLRDVAGVHGSAVA